MIWKRYLKHPVHNGTRWSPGEPLWPGDNGVRLQTISRGKWTVASNGQWSIGHALPLHFGAFSRNIECGKSSGRRLNLNSVNSQTSFVEYWKGTQLPKGSRSLRSPIVNIDILHTRLTKTLWQHCLGENWTNLTIRVYLLKIRKQKSYGNSNQFVPKFDLVWYSY